MPKYTVIGAHRETGKRVKISFQAPSEQAAEETARARGVLITSITAEPDQSDLADQVLASIPPSNVAPPQPNLPPRSMRVAPAFSGVRACAFALRIIGCISAIGALFCLYETVRIIPDGRYRMVQFQLAVTLSVITWSVLMFAAGFGLDMLREWSRDQIGRA